MATQTQRDELCGLMDWLHEHGEQVHYPPVIHGQIVRQVRVSRLGVRTPADMHRLVGARGGLVLDCSQMFIVLLESVGLHVSDIDGATSTLLRDPRLPHYYDPREAYAGAGAVYGAGGGHHITATRFRDPVHGNPVQFSQGQESDPRYISLLSEAAHQPAPITMLSIAKL